MGQLYVVKWFHLKNVISMGYENSAKFYSERILSLFYNYKVFGSKY